MKTTNDTFDALEDYNERKQKRKELNDKGIFLYFPKNYLELLESYPTMGNNIIEKISFITEVFSQGVLVEGFYIKI